MSGARGRRTRARAPFPAPLAGKPQLPNKTLTAPNRILLSKKKVQKPKKRTFCCEPSLSFPPPRGSSLMLLCMAGGVRSSRGLKDIRAKFVAKSFSQGGESSCATWHAASPQSKAKHLTLHPSDYYPYLYRVSGGPRQASS